MADSNEQSTVLLSQCTGAVFRAATVTLMAVVCPSRQCGVTVPVVEGVLDAHLGMAGDCSLAGARVVDDRISVADTADASNAVVSS
ncbi:hypothetical protein [Nocardia tenerifensis]|uniref:hypothetical protein n=1 Tax=Nocardia tenerifensis TaxID=228006 RepID=UPI0005925344|nr:hypothetical protein [Nocardia tenerifensis]